MELRFANRIASLISRATPIKELIVRPHLSLIPALLLAASPAAMAAAPAKDSEIVVKGSNQEIRDTLKDMIDEAKSSEQLGRFEQKLCPRVIGYPADWTETLQRLVRKNATAAGLKLQKDDCRPNALIIFIDEPQKLVSELGKAQPDFFGFKTGEERAAIAAEYQPIYSWRVTDIRSANGEELGRVNQFNGGPADAYIVRNAKATRTSENTRQDITLSFAVMDIKRTEGKTMRQLADIATMHLLLDLAKDADKAANPDSILTLFANDAEPTSMPKRMSVMDKAVLSGMYRYGDNAQKANVQRGRIAQEVKRKEKEAAGQTEN
jgi:hypothetical protein